MHNLGLREIQGSALFMNVLCILTKAHSRNGLVLFNIEGQKACLISGVYWALIKISQCKHFGKNFDHFYLFLKVEIALAPQSKD